MQRKALHIISILLLLGAAPLHAQTINGNVYGGGEMATVEGSTNVTIEDGRFTADIFGGGEGKLYTDEDEAKDPTHKAGSVSMSADVSGSTNVTINGGEFAVGYDESKPQPYPFKQHYNIYGGGNIASQVGETHVYVTKGMVSNASDDTGSFLDNDRFESGKAGMAQAYYHEGQMYFCVFGGGYGKNTSVTGNTWVDFHIGSGDGIKDIEETVIEDDLLEYQSYLDVIGGGFNGTIKGNTNVHVGGNAMCRNVYGGGLYATIGTKDDAETGNTNVHITGGNIDNVYGGGVMGDIMTSTNVNIGLKEQLTFDTRDYAVANDKITILMSVYGANDVSGHVPQANITHNGGTIDQNIYGAGNGDYRGYYTPGVCDYADGENGNYFYVNHSGDTSKDGKGTKGPKGNTYKGRPQTDNVSITMGGNSAADKAVVLGQVFGGGNSCTVGKWHTEWVESGGKYAGNEHSARDDKDYFKGEGSINITLNSHVAIGYDNTTLASSGDDITEMYTRDGENVSGLFMGCSGDVLATQSTAKDDYDYHHYYDSYTAQYWPGFAVFDNSGQPLSREDGLASFKAYLNNILVWSNDVTLSIDNDAEDIWLANFVGGGFRGSMKRKDGNAYQWTLPAGVTVGNCVVGGAYNTDVVYRVYDTEDDMHTYKETDGHYSYRTDIKDGWNEGEDYHHIEYAADGTTITGIVRFYYDGGILSNDGSTTRDITKLTLANNMDATDTSKRRIFAGCFTSGTTEGNTIIDYTGTGAPRIHGGGAYAHVNGNATVNIKDGEADDVYGGGALANVVGNTVVNLTGGSISSAYGGGLGSDEVAALVNGDATTTLNGSKVNGSIFGANNINGTPKGHVKVHVLSTTPREGQGAEDFDVPAVYGGGNLSAYEPTASDDYAEVLIENCDNSIAYVYGGGNAAPVPATQVTIKGANAIDNAFAGGNGAGQSTDPSAANYNPGADIGYLDYTRNDPAKEYGTGIATINVQGGTIYHVYGGSNTLGYIRDHAAVNVEAEGTCPMDVAELYGGGKMAPGKAANINIICTGENGKIDNVYGGAHMADLTGDIELNISGGQIGNVFGGNNESGTIDGSITVNIDWATGDDACGNNSLNNVYGGGNLAPYTTPEGKEGPIVNLINGAVTNNVYGGGLGATAVVTGNPMVNITGGSVGNDVFGGGSLANTDGSTAVTVSGGTVTHDVYGGGALANVSGNTVVNLTGGSISSAYGGGLGQLAADAVGTEGDPEYQPAKEAVSALVFGDATTTLNGSVVNGSIFGANNINGTPLGHVKVHVLKTQDSGGTYHVAAVYGGGNQAAYVPMGSYSTDGCLTDRTKFAEVLIEGCDNSIEYVYGGGNAAPVPATDVTIYGGTIGKAFAGGNGQGDGNKGADIGYLGFYSETEEATPQYGAGMTKMTIYGGTIEDVYGGSNTLGYIRTSASVEVDKVPDDYEGEACPLNVTNVHGGGNNAPMYCNGSVTLNCTKGVDVIFGGAENADIHGNIELNITSGTYKQVFCGNNNGGNIDGSLKVNIDETGCWPIIIGELYGCGNNAAYSVYGYDADGNCVTSGEKQYEDPEVNVISCTSIGKIFGAGKGERAVVYGDPTVNINTIEGVYAGQTVAEGFMILDGNGERNEASVAERSIPAGVGSIGTIYGGGNAGAVYGSTTVNIGTSTTNKHIKDKDDDSVEPEDVAVIITGNVFGGGNEAIVSGDTNVKIGEDN